MSDHGLVSCRLPVLSGSAPEQVRRVRVRRSVDQGVLREAIQASALGCPPPPSQHVDDMFAAYDTVLRDIADRLSTSCTLICVRCRRGSILTTGPLVDTVAVWNVAITGLTATLTAVHGSLRRGPS